MTPAPGMPHPAKLHKRMLPGRGKSMRIGKFPDEPEKDRAAEELANDARESSSRTAREVYRSLDQKGKRQYFEDYILPKLLVAAAALAAVLFLLVMVFGKSSTDYSVYALFMDYSLDSSSSERLTSALDEAFDTKTSQKPVLLDDSKKMQLQGKEQLETLLYNRQVDVIIADRDVFTELAADGDVLDLSQVFTEKELTSFAAEMGREAGSGDDSYGGLLLKTPGYLESEDVDETGVGKGEEEYYGLDLTGCRLLSENDAGDSETSDLVLMVAGNTERLSGAVRFTEVLLELE